MEALKKAKGLKAPGYHTEHVVATVAIEGIAPYSSSRQFSDIEKRDKETRAP